MGNRLISAAVGAVLALSAAAASADEYREGAEDTPGAGTMVFDLVVIRPVSLVATVLGTGLFILSVPLSIIQGEPPSKPATRLVMEPARYTFKRPLGQMESPNN